MVLFGAALQNPICCLEPSGGKWPWGTMLDGGVVPFAFRPRAESAPKLIFIPMKLQRALQKTLSGCLSLILLGSLVVPHVAEAKPGKKGSSSKEKHKSSSKKGKDIKKNGNKHSESRDRSESSDQREYDEALSRYNSRPRSSFRLTPGTGYAGRGYYFGPPGVPYYYERSGVQYYRSREAAPREYWESDYHRTSVETSVQQALAKRGYYRGPIDGTVGPYTRQEIARYQEDHGLRPTGLISDSLLRSLGLD